MPAPQSKLRKLAKAVVDALAAGCSADELNPTFTPRLKWVPAESLKTLSGLVVNVAPASMDSKRMTRTMAERHSFIAIQVAKKVTKSAQADFDTEVDGLMLLVESIDAWFMRESNQRITDDALNTYSLVGCKIVETLDWELLEESRTFQAVLLLDYFSAG